MIHRRRWLRLVWMDGDGLATGRADAATIITNGGFTVNNTPLPGGTAYGSNVAGRDTISVNAQGTSSEPVWLHFTFNAGGYNSIGLTDIAFDQVVVAVPESASLAAAAFVALGLASVQRRSIGRRGSW